MKEEIDLLVAVINRWWTDYSYVAMDKKLYKEEAFFNFSEELKELSPNLSFTYDMKENKWIINTDEKD